ncbi:hypothetical protein AB7M56_006939 [Bradyrhizobium elkanii]|jgi:hypothetical protein|nr:hypothetical protein [Bradyrhizobium elkanii]MCS3520114.1 hypothetical protein [Bradyrhizobium elkanii]MCS4067769.1 hypothetical protein [Bradyrhizobium elkanii]MCS4083305.1 hypothetical protein [Bradyrhizobium elkanii]MCS4105575.1 hypothetical protein [Bradyrhizobium elkanii]
MEAARSLANFVRDKADSQPFSLMPIQVQDIATVRWSKPGSYCCRHAPGYQESGQVARIPF